MYQFLNVHPKKKLVADCVKRALTLATKLDYMDVQRELNRIKREKKASAANLRPVYEQFINSHSGEKMWFPAVKGMPRMNGEEFCKRFPKGTYILSMAHHLTTCIDGVIYDTWDCSKKCVYMAYKM